MNLKFQTGDLVEILPPEGINDTEAHREVYARDYKGRVFEVVRSRVKSVQIADNHSVTVEEVTVLVPGPPLSPILQKTFGDAATTDREANFYAWSLKRKDGLEAIFSWLDEQADPKVESEHARS